MWAHMLLSIILTTNGEAAKERLCIVGAGVSGLTAAKYFGEHPNEFEPVVFEKNSDVGGLWFYTNSTSADEHGLPVHSSMYKNLRTVVPKEMMTFLDYPYFGGEAHKGRFVEHEVVLEYLRNYTDQFQLRKYIQFNTNVEKITPLPNLRWLIATKNWNTRRKSTTSCDVVVICNGHDTKGYIPKISGIENFSGRVLHSHVYREPKAFANQTVVILGARNSGMDIGVQISSEAEKVYLSHRHAKLPDVFPSNLEQVPGVVAAKSRELILSNGTKIRADALVFCTGYVYDYPFLDETSGIVVEDGKYIRSIYKHLVNIKRPTMAIINVPQPGLNFENPRAQLLYFIAILRGKLSLPSREQMLMDAQLPANVPKSKAHSLVSGDKEYIYGYINELALAAGGELLPWWFIPAGDELDKLITDDPVHYKSKRLVVHEDDRRVEFV